MLAGSGTAGAVGVVKVASSKTKEPPLGSPLIVTLEMPAAKFTLNGSFGLLPAFPEQGGPARHARLSANFEVTEATGLFALLKAVRVNGSK